MLLLTNLKVTESFNHHRDVANINTDSREDVETTTIDVDDLVDSREHLNHTSTETSNDVHDDLSSSSEDLANSTAVPIETVIDDSAFDVLDDLRDKIHDDLHEIASSENIIKRSVLTGEVPAAVHRDFSREDFADFFHHDANNNHAAAIDALDDIYDDYSFEVVPTQPLIPAQVQPAEPQTAQSVVDHHDVHDFSLEDFAQQDAIQQGQTVHVDYDDLSTEDIIEANLGAVQPAAVSDSTHTIVQQGEVHQGRSVGVDIDDVSAEDIVDPTGAHHLEAAQPAVVFDPTHPAAGEHVFSHPASDDWFLVKQYMDDYYFWELGDDLAKEYFWQPIKATKILQFDSAERLNADQFAQFTPVRSLWNDRVGSTVVA